MRFGTRVRNAGLGNFWKSRVRVRQDSAIKKLLKIFLFIFYLYFLYIFTIKIFLKNTLLCLDSQNKERRRQETHYYASEVGILATSARFKADFGLFSRFNLFRTPADMTQYGRYGPILTESAQFGPNLSRVSANQAKSARIWGKKKKKLRCDWFLHSLISPSIKLCSLIQW